MAPRPRSSPPLSPQPPPGRPPDLPAAAGYPLGRWLSWQRHLHYLGTLDPARAQVLERLGGLWDPRQQAFDRGLAHAAAYAGRHGHLVPPVEYIHDDFPLGRWPATQRTRADRLTSERATALAALDRWWNPPWAITWQRAHHAARQSGEGSQTQAWLGTQGARADDLHPEQHILLTQLGLELLDTPASCPDDSLLPPRERAFGRERAAARAFLNRGHLDVPQRHIEEIAGEDVRRGQWLSNLRRAVRA
ncbi:helicase associated domain-containing protein [Streptomyces sp. NPDC051920]|uniref:helicase associated domain-containing protein n=1 Tax=Streptomyces sp. NPDC051920 TaxID=3155523 RepID=UPI00343EAF71